MVAAPQCSLESRVGDAILKSMEFSHGQLKITPQVAARAALGACHAEEMRKLMEEAEVRLAASEYVRDHKLAEKIQVFLAKLESGA